MDAISETAVQRELRGQRDVDDEVAVEQIDCIDVADVIHAAEVNTSVGERIARVGRERDEQDSEDYGDLDAHQFVPARSEGVNFVAQNSMKGASKTITMSPGVRTGGAAGVAPTGLR